MLVSLIPPLSIVLLNLVICAYVVREGAHVRSGFFLIMNALSLIIWSGGQMLYRALDREVEWVLSLPYLAALIVPGNFLYYVLTRPKPFHPVWSGSWGPFLIFLPVVLLTLEEIRSGGFADLFDYSLAAPSYDLQTNSHRVAALYCALTLAATLGVLTIRYYNGSGPSRNLAKHLIAAVAGPLIFAGFFWATMPGMPAPVLPSPSLVFALMAQVGLIVALRQEELRSPRAVSSALYYAAIVLVAFLFVGLLAEFYFLAQGHIILQSTFFWIMAVLVVAAVFFTRMTWMERRFEQLVFARAAEYRRLVEETRSELSQSRERLRKAERLSAIGELAARMAHEIKNPLGPIKGYTQMMREKVERDSDFPNREAFLRHLEVIAEEVETIDGRLRQFLASARQPRLEQEPADVNRIADRCAKLLEMEIQAAREIAPGEPEIDIRVHLQPDLPDITGDAARLEEAIFNLARNALDSVQDARIEGGYIRLETRTADSVVGKAGVEVLVRDNGNGLPPVEPRQLFEPFYSSKESGTGLGLAIVKGSVEAHGGEVTLENHPDGGAEARIWLPLEAAPNPEALQSRVASGDAAPSSRPR